MHSGTVRREQARPWRALPHRPVAGRYRQAFVLQGSWKSALVPFFARSERTGYRGEVPLRPSNDIVPRQERDRRKTAHMFQRLAGGGEFLPPRLGVDHDNRARLLDEHKLAGRNFVCLMPGAEFGPAKRWPAQRYATLAAGLLRRDLAVVVLGSPRDAPVGADIAAAAPEVVDLAAGRAGGRRRPPVGGPCRASPTTAG